MSSDGGRPGPAAPFLVPRASFPGMSPSTPRLRRLLEPIHIALEFLDRLPQLTDFFRNKVRLAVEPGHRVTSRPADTVPFILADHRAKYGCGTMVTQMPQSLDSANPYSFLRVPQVLGQGLANSLLFTCTPG